MTIPVEALLPALKASIPITSAAYDAYLIDKLFAAKVTLERDHAIADLSDPAARDLVVMYARWLHQSSRDPTVQMPPALRLQINNGKVDMSHA